MVQITRGYSVHLLGYMAQMLDPKTKICRGQVIIHEKEPQTVSQQQVQSSRATLTLCHSVQIGNHIY
jgi:translation elongation factor EF-1alpha